MIKIIPSLVLLLLLAVISGCAAKPEAIAPAYVSHLTYMHLNLEQLNAEEERLSRALAAASDAQRSARTNDTVGVIFLGLPVSSLSGSNQAANIARLKGELDALQRARVEKMSNRGEVGQTTQMGTPAEKSDAPPQR